MTNDRYSPGSAGVPPAASRVPAQGSPSDRIAALHAAYCQATGFVLTMDMNREQAWFEWLRRGLTPDDVRLLVRHHRDRARQGKPARSLTFRNFVMSVDYAEEDLAELRARNRRQEPPPNREAVLKATHRPTPDPGDAIPMATIIANMRAAVERGTGVPPVSNISKTPRQA